MSWNSHEPQASKNSMTAQASTFSIRTPQAHNNVSSILLWNSHNIQASKKFITSKASTFSTTTVPRNFTCGNQYTSYTPLPFNDSSSSASVTTK